MELESRPQIGRGRQAKSLSQEKARSAVWGEPRRPTRKRGRETALRERAQRLEGKDCEVSDLIRVCVERECLCRGRVHLFSGRNVSVRTTDLGELSDYASWLNRAHYVLYSQIREVYKLALWVHRSSRRFAKAFFSRCLTLTLSFCAGYYYYNNYKRTPTTRTPTERG